MSTSAESVRAAEAGHWGKEIRSDLHVALEPRDRGGLEITLESRVALYYGESIRAQARQVLEALGIKNARVTIHDEGALPYVISARLETAAKRAGLASDQKALPESIGLPQPSAKDRLRRSRLYLPGSEPKYSVNAGLHGPDAIILDLEDSVHARQRTVGRKRAAVRERTAIVEVDQEHLLLRSVAPDNKQAAAGWWNEFGKGRMCYLSPGHTVEAISHPMTQLLLRNAVKWVLHEDGKGKGGRSAESTQ